MLQGAQGGLRRHGDVGRVVPMVVKPPVVRRQAWYRSAALPWAAAATLALRHRLPVLVGRPHRLAGTSSPVALVPVTLRPASRGAEATIPLGSGTGPATLAVEINDPHKAAS